jgi:hypothetical protein
MAAREKKTGATAIEGRGFCHRRCRDSRVSGFEPGASLRVHLLLSGELAERCRSDRAGSRSDIPEGYDKRPQASAKRVDNA